MLLVLVEHLAGAARDGRRLHLVAPREGPAALAWRGLTVVAPALRAVAAPPEALRPPSPPAAREAGLFAVRRLLAREPGHDLRAVALRVGRPVDGLADELRACGTTFQLEQRAARLARGVELLVRTPLKIEAIAREIGYASKPSFIAAMRELAGFAPGALREALGETTSG